MSDLHQQITESSKENQVRKFNPINCDIRTRLEFEEWATIPMLRIVTLLLASTGSIFNYRNIAVMADVSTSTAHASIKKLIEEGYLREQGGNFSLNLGNVQKTEQAVQKIVQNVQKTKQAVQNSEHNNNKIIIINNNNKIRESTHPPKSKFLDLSKKSLDYSETHENDNRFILLGRRPMKNYPEIWLSEMELCSVLEIYEQDGIPIDGEKRYSKAFLSVNSKLQTKRVKGERMEFTNPYDWLIGFAKHDLLRELSASASLKRQEKYLEAAR